MAEDWENTKILRDQDDNPIPQIWDSEQKKFVPYEGQVKLTGSTVGSKADGSESVNAVVADFTLHDRAEDIDPEGYLSQVPGGGGE